MSANQNLFKAFNAFMASQERENSLEAPRADYAQAIIRANTKYQSEITDQTPEEIRQRAIQTRDQAKEEAKMRYEASIRGLVKSTMGTSRADEDINEKLVGVLASNFDKDAVETDGYDVSPSRTYTDIGSDTSGASTERVGCQNNGKTFTLSNNIEVSVTRDARDPSNLSERISKNGIVIATNTSSEYGVDVDGANGGLRLSKKDANGNLKKGGITLYRDSDGRNIADLSMNNDKEQRVPLIARERGLDINYGGNAQFDLPRISMVGENQEARLNTSIKLSRNESIIFRNGDDDGVQNAFLKSGDFEKQVTLSGESNNIIEPDAIKKAQAEAKVEINIQDLKEQGVKKPEGVGLRVAQLASSFLPEGMLPNSAKNVIARNKLYAHKQLKEAVEGFNKSADDLKEAVQNKDIAKVEARGGVVGAGKDDRNNIIYQKINAARNIFAGVGQEPAAGGGPRPIFRNLVSAGISWGAAASHHAHELATVRVGGRAIPLGTGMLAGTVAGLTAGITGATIGGVSGTGRAAWKEVSSNVNPVSNTSNAAHLLRAARAVNQKAKGLRCNAGKYANMEQTYSAEAAINTIASEMIR